MTKEQQEEVEKNYTPVWEEGSQRVVNYEGWNIFVEPDKVCCLPFLQEYNSILLRVEPVPSYKLRNPEQSDFLTCMSETMKDNESPEQTLRRGLIEEFGIKLDNSYKVEFDGELYQFKGGDTKVHICLIPLMEHDYLDVPILTDGSKEEKNSKIVKVDLKYLNSLKPSDLTTAFLINKLKLYLKS